ncbi:MAG: putative molybdenum carrier protein [Candidatus Thiodiazotropha taylori]|nr:putative molybdenum carrier protein [Candidatus Thiodiazotropha taylori]MCW4226766.1 putative molybdenum carrier protein [Candidatus Thiodiazotropha endolucinida]MCG7883141.1 putative molybdenum carrier protein [Candidatus Thiodiazotropha taylori]MCG7888328.1 putative molybdenum carrier protein [Candidatus Thiodiazotropha taylori]MCG7890749.1 putative molybdenum carrier protein [Candidatus Thiodiazotropha taylori]
MTHRPSKIISGGQTGADIGGLVGAKRVGISTGGYAPRGYKTEAGPQSEALKEFGLVELPTSSYKHRTKQNVFSSDATLIVATDTTSNGTQLTIKYCKQLKKPFLVIEPTKECCELLRIFLNNYSPRILNVAGNRESKSKGIALKTAAIIQAVLSATN